MRRFVHGPKEHGTVLRHHNNNNAPRWSSSSAAATPAAPLDTSAPTGLTLEIAQGVQDATLLYVEHGLGRRRLDALAANDAGANLVTRWQHMMEAFLGTQVHVLAGLGYEASERGIALYNQHLARLMQQAPPDAQERLRVQGRDLWRTTLRRAFALEGDDDQGERTIVEARNIMFKVSERMQAPDILEKIVTLSNNAVRDDANNNNNNAPPGNEMTRRHTVVQQVLVEDVYLGGNPSLVEDCGFGTGEHAYVRMQSAMAEHQSDPLVAQYVGGGMMKVLQAAGIDINQLQQPNN